MAPTFSFERIKNFLTTVMSNCSTLLVFRVWQEWEVENNTFVSMEMQQGDDCGQIRRSVKVLVLKCGVKGWGVYKCLCTCSHVCL